VGITARTKDGYQIQGEENIDLGKFHGDKPLDEVKLVPANIKASPDAMKALKAADVIIAGPGDLYTTILPTLIIPEIKNFLLKQKKKQIFIVNVANKPFETRNYDVSHYIDAVTKHLTTFPFQTIVVNNNVSYQIPEKFNYKYVTIDPKAAQDFHLILDDIVDASFPIYHDSDKLARVVLNNI
jgi:uncharacterized cofD-like protein